MATTEPRWFEVTSPEYMTFAGDPLMNGDPPEYGRDWLPVFTTSKRRAKVLAVRAWRRKGDTYVSADPWANPFTNLEAWASTPCQHGRPSCRACRECDSLWMADLAEGIAELSAGGTA